MENLPRDKVVPAAKVGPGGRAVTRHPSAILRAIRLLFRFPREAGGAPAIRNPLREYMA